MNAVSTPEISRNYSLLLLVIGWCASIPVKFVAAQQMPWDIDYIPVIARNVDFLQGGALPAYGTLSSVAAYNMPFLEWLHIPAMLITDDVWWIVWLTMLAFNALSTLAIYLAGVALLQQPRWGVAAALLFTFSEVGISSAYTAWGQLLLPGFFVMTLWSLWQWRQTAQGMYLAVSGLIATAAFMTHFAAILLFPAMLVFALASRARWQWRWLLVGSIGVMVMIAPYLLAEFSRDFVNLRAFLSQETRVDEATLQQYKEIAYNTASSAPAANPAPVVTDSPAVSTPSSASTTVPRWQRGLEFARTVPAQYITIFDSGFRVSFRTLPGWMQTAAAGLQGSLHLLYWVGLAAVLAQTGRAWWHSNRSLQALQDVLVRTPAGRLTLVVLFLFTVATGIILTRNTEQTSYFTGFHGIQWLFVVYPLALIAARLTPRSSSMLAAGIVVMFASMQSMNRIGRVLSHDDSVYSEYNISLYRHIDAAVMYIAADWQRDHTDAAAISALTIAYDILPDVPHYWWIAAWHQIDPLYRMGTPYDFLLEFEQGLTNTNTDPIGDAANPDYIVVYEPGLARYDRSQYTIQRFGTIYILEPLP